MYVIAVILAIAAQLDRHPLAALAAGAAGAPAMGAFHARGGAFVLGQRPVPLPAPGGGGSPGRRW
jgi:hypothetical protein